jgi:hypothetical protein
VIDWQQFCCGAEGVTIARNGIDVITPNQRRHRVRIRETVDSYDLSAVVARPAALRDVPDASLRAWRRNRGMELVGFRIDRRGRLVGEAWVPKAGLGREEFLLYVRRVAAECDEFEFRLTGKDRE